MKRLHVHVSVNDLSESVRFYRGLFATEPTVLKHDYAKWMLEDPRVNFAISTRSTETGLRHLGIQVESLAELDEIEQRAVEAGLVASGRLAGERRKLLLRPVRQAMVDRSPGHRLGGIPYRRRHSHLRRTP
jgi:hypothetical protein